MGKIRTLNDESCKHADEAGFFSANLDVAVQGLETKPGYLWTLPRKKPLCKPIILWTKGP